MTTDLVPAVDYTTEIERSADPGEYVVQTLERAKVWLTQALEHGDIGQIVELKSQAEAIRVYTMSKQLGKDAELAAAEIVRRAEQGLAVAVQRGQRAGEVKAAGRPSKPTPMDVGFDVPKRSDFFASQKEMDDAYAMAEATDEKFEDALTAAKAEGNLSRANVVRKVKGAAGSPRRRPITDSVRDAVFTALRSAEAVARLQADDRWNGNASKTDPLTRDNLRRAIQLLSAFADSVNAHEESN